MKDLIITTLANTIKFIVFAFTFLAIIWIMTAAMKNTVVFIGLIVAIASIGCWLYKGN